MVFFFSKLSPNHTHLYFQCYLNFINFLKKIKKTLDKIKNSFKDINRKENIDMRKKIRLEINKRISKESDVNSKLIIPYLNSRQIRYDRIEPSRTNISCGIPDFVIDWKGKFIFVEVKYEKNTLRPNQRQWFAKYKKNNFLLWYKNNELWLYDAKEVLLLIKEGVI